ncbi:MAG: hypothetical protein CSA96_09580 [Bacteroidetes bacterium]|nr:MAG: hypothetical protein CSA96_09580 [Bacteroidota bacterium]
MYRVLSIFLLAGLCQLQAGAQIIPDGMGDAFGKGDAKALSAFFHESLEMTITGTDHHVSKAQATRILDSFFKSNPPLAFQVSFEGLKENSKYAIGTLKTENNTYRVNIFFLDREKQKLIYYLTIEKASLYELEP